MYFQVKGVCVFLKKLLIKNMIYKATTVEHQPLQHRSDGLFPRKCEGEKTTIIARLVTLYSWVTMNVKECYSELLEM